MIKKTQCFFTAGSGLQKSDDGLPAILQLRVGGSVDARCCNRDSGGHTGGCAHGNFVHCVVQKAAPQVPSARETGFHGGHAAKQQAQCLRR